MSWASAPPSSCVTFPVCRSCGLEQWAGLGQWGELSMAISGSVWFGWTTTLLQKPAALPLPVQSCTAGLMEAPPPLGECDAARTSSSPSQVNDKEAGLHVSLIIEREGAGGGASGVQG